MQPKKIEKIPFALITEVDTKWFRLPVDNDRDLTRNVSNIGFLKSQHMSLKLFNESSVITFLFVLMFCSIARF